jgi:hypothetical protein
MSDLPKPSADPELVQICILVARGHLQIMDGIQQLRNKMSRYIDGHTDINKLSVLAVLLVEQTHPPAKGLLLSPEDLQTMWRAPQQTTETHPDLHMSFLVLSCLQLTSMGEPHEGAKVMTQALDQMLPEHPSINLN